MKRVRTDEVDNAVRPAAVTARLTEPLDRTDVAINYYELAPGDSFAFAFHAHEVQAERFVVLSDTATRETADDPDAVATTRDDCGGEVARWTPGPDGETHRVDPAE